jgi:hypothetical protein
MDCDNLVVLEIFGSIIFVTACIVETTELKRDKIATEHASDTALTLALVLQQWLIGHQYRTYVTQRDVCAPAFLHK